MKNILIICFLFWSNLALAQNLYLIFDPNEPDITKDVRKYLGKRGSTTPIIRTCGVGKISEYYYLYDYYFYTGEGLKLKKKEGTTPVYKTVAETQILYPNAMNGAQLDQAMQPIIEQEYAMTAPFPEEHLYPTVQYFRQFQKIFVIEYVGNGQAQVVEVRIMNTFE